MASCCSRYFTSPSTNKRTSSALAESFETAVLSATIEDPPTRFTSSVIRAFPPTSEKSITDFTGARPIDFGLYSKSTKLSGRSTGCRVTSSSVLTTTTSASGSTPDSTSTKSPSASPSVTSRLSNRVESLLSRITTNVTPSSSTTLASGSTWTSNDRPENFLDSTFPILNPPSRNSWSERVTKSSSSFAASSVFDLSGSGKGSTPCFVIAVAASVRTEFLPTNVLIGKQRNRSMPAEKKKIRAFIRSRRTIPRFMNLPALVSGLHDRTP